MWQREARYRHDGTGAPKNITQTKKNEREKEHHAHEVHEVNQVHEVHEVHDVGEEKDLEG